METDETYESYPPSYSAFWPLLILVVFLGVWIGNRIVEINEERVGAEDGIRQMLPQAQAAMDAKKKLLSLARDIDELAAKDAAAAQIVSEFKIHGPSAARPEAPPATEDTNAP